MKKIYGIKDEDLGFRFVFNLDNDAIAIRGFTEECNKPNTDANKYPEKVSLWSLGTLNDETGEIKPEVKKLLGAEQCKLSAEKSM